MDKKPYRVLDGANLDLFPRGTKVGDIVRLTDGEALYERDMGRIVSPDAPVPGETKGYPADATTGEALDLTDEERARIQAEPDLGASGGTTSLVEGRGPSEGVQLGTGEHPADTEKLPETMSAADRAEPGTLPVGRARRAR